MGLGDNDALHSHPVVAASWEAFAVEQLLAAAPDGVQGHFYRTSGGAEVDLVLSFPRGELWAIEIKRSLTPRPRKGFHSACEDFEPAQRFVVYPGDARYPVGDDVHAIPLEDLARQLAGAR